MIHSKKLKIKISVIAFIFSTAMLAILAPVAKDYYDQYQYQKYMQSNAIDHAAHHQ